MQLPLLDRRGVDRLLLAAGVAFLCLAAFLYVMVPEGRVVFVVQRKPVVTFRNRAPKPHMLDFDDPAQLPAMLERAFAPTAGLQRALADYADAIHPARDGRASERVLAATEALIAGDLGPLERKPFGTWFRELQIRRELGYWGRRG